MKFADRSNLLYTPPPSMSDPAKRTGLPSTGRSRRIFRGPGRVGGQRSSSSSVTLPRVPAHIKMAPGQPGRGGGDGRSLYNPLPPITLEVSPLFNDGWFAAEQEAKRAAKRAAAAAREDALLEAALPSLTPTTAEFIFNLIAFLNHRRRFGALLEAADPDRAVRGLAVRIPAELAARKQQWLGGTGDAEVRRAAHAPPPTRTTPGTQPTQAPPAPWVAVLGMLMSWWSCALAVEPFWVGRVRMSWCSFEPRAPSRTSVDAPLVPPPLGRAPMPTPTCHPNPQFPSLYVIFPRT